MTQQLVLPLKLAQEKTFDNFIVGSNQEVFSYLTALFTDRVEQFIYLWGARGFGKSHLLQACCHQSFKLNKQAFYLSLQNTSAFQPTIFQSLENYDLICVDDIHCILGKKTWEEALFHLYNRIRAHKHCLIVSAKKAPTDMPFSLLDLQSRLTWGLTFHLTALSDQEKSQALQGHARAKGIHLSPEVLQFITTHYPRDMKALLQLLVTLEEKSLIEKRRITVPFVKSIL